MSFEEKYKEALELLKSENINDESIIYYDSFRRLWNIEAVCSSDPCWIGEAGGQIVVDAETLEEAVDLLTVEIHKLIEENK